MAFLVVFGNAKNANMCRKDLDDNGGDTNPLGGQEGHLVSKKKKKSQRRAAGAVSCGPAQTTS